MINNNIKLYIKLLISLLLFSTPIFVSADSDSSKSNYDSNKILSMKLPLEIQNKIDKLNKIKDTFKETLGTEIRMHANLRSSGEGKDYWEFINNSRAIEEKCIQMLADLAIDYYNEIKNINELLINIYGEVPIWINNYNLSNDYISKKMKEYIKKKIPENIPQDIDNQINIIIALKKEENENMSLYRTYIGMTKVAKELKNDKEVIDYKKLAEDLGKHIGIENGKTEDNKYKTMLEQENNNLNKQLIKIYGEIPIWIERIMAIKRINSEKNSIEKLNIEINK